MFSGIVKGLEKPTSLSKNKNGMRVTLPVPKGWKLLIGESVSVDGICSTIERVEKNTFSVYYMPETLRKTMLSALSNTHEFNLERSLTLNSLIGGHLVSGHIDTTSKIISIVKDGDSKTLTFLLNSRFTKYIIYKGSIAVNGVSLTIVSVNKNSFTVSLIPYTLSHTNLGSLKVGNTVNIELDLIAKYLEKLLR
ncbi:MAG: riboflavin synthase [bacterium]|nr:riboflavin synthase [bacterium]